jgi:hypothetical protein
LPPAKLSPNARLHYMAKAKVMADAKKTMLAHILEQPRPKILLTRATVTVKFIVPTRGKRDKGNLI